jgi:hypothetical protein
MLKALRHHSLMTGTAEVLVERRLLRRDHAGHAPAAGAAREGRALKRQG